MNQFDLDFVVYVQNSIIFLLRRAFMRNFVFNAFTEMIFGKGQMNQLPEILKKYGRNVLLVYGGGSIKKNGIYDKAMELLADYNITELAGVEPNPKIETVRKGVQLCREHEIDVILAIGGGSTIDCAKVVAGGYYYSKDPWDIVVDGSLVTDALPVVTVLTLAATGSEMNSNAVISNMELHEKLGTSSEKFMPRTSILDPEFTYGVPRIQTAAGTADIMSHVFESYFMNEKGTFIQDRFAEGILQACIKYGPIALESPCNYDARANLMWASSMALNGLCGAGKGDAWSCHPIEHELSAFYDITHGVGLAIITPRWMRYVLNEKTVKKFVKYARNVWHMMQDEDEFQLANKAIDATENFFRDCRIPMKLGEIGIDSTHFKEMSRKAVYNGGLIYSYVPLDENAVMEILEACL